MATTRFLTLLIAGVLLSTTGCSGSRLRNLVSRADYASMDEIDAIEAERKAADERQESLAELAESERTDVLVSRERELPDRESDEETAARKSFFDFAKVFSRKSESDEFSPDPFAEGGNDEKNEDVKVAKTRQTSEFADEKTSSPKEKSLSGTISDVEKQAENLFDEAFATQDSLRFEEANGTAAAMQDAGTEQPHEESFADFIRDQQAKQKVVTEHKPVVVAAQLPDTANSSKTATSPATMSRFDAFLSDATAGAESRTASMFSLDLFPDVHEDQSQGFDAPETAPPKDTQRNAKNPFSESTAIAKQIDSPFEETSRNHGFTAGKQDPWAAFDNSRGSSWTADHSVEPSPPEDEIVWNNEPLTVDDGDSNPFAAMEIEAAAGAADGTRDSVFQQVSSTRPVDVRRAVDVSESAPLIIPHAEALDTRPPQDFNNWQSGNEFAPQTSTVTSDPFLTSVPQSDPPVDLAAEVADPGAVAPIAANQSGGIGQWSRRTWFLLIGCVIVALLLFMPDRHNRTNA